MADAPRLVTVTELARELGCNRLVVRTLLLERGDACEFAGRSLVMTREVAEDIRAAYEARHKDYDYGSRPIRGRLIAS